MTTSLQIAPSFSWADSRLSSQQINQMVERGELISVVSLQERYPALLGGRWLDIELEQEHQHWIYEFEIINEQGVVTEIEFDAVTGELLNVEVDD
ncbi:PepSY domain-containing protein [Reinekea blandensis]|uniref:PepSY domain-containing protein n=1 Tax=Reinekea blandensis MED297 TaxID=314283 RepID=A4BGK8_9GAMM|nr:PepSY domain-containing protein [Reinekea blandensis]EAR08814.1 hypothetical protein MED297_09121 [Reinekea sp. MED297] [Reinekea blandensis MED297]